MYGSQEVHQEDLRFIQATVWLHAQQEVPFTTPGWRPSLIGHFQIPR